MKEEEPNEPIIKMEPLAQPFEEMLLTRTPTSVDHATDDKNKNKNNDNDDNKDDDSTRPVNPAITSTDNLVAPSLLIDDGNPNETDTSSSGWWTGGWKSLVQTVKQEVPHTYMIQIRIPLHTIIY